MKEELIKLYEQYLKETITERTHEWMGDDGKMTKALWKGDFDGFMNWLKQYEKETPNMSTM